MRKRRQRRLHAHLDGLHRTEGHISEEFGRGTGTKEDNGAVRIREQLVSVEVFEVFVEAVFTGALEGVADEGGGPAEEDAAKAFFGYDGAPSGEVGGVDFGVDLTAAFYKVERGNGCVSWACGEGLVLGMVVWLVIGWLYVPQAVRGG